MSNAPGKQKTTIQPAERVHVLAKKIALISGMSVSGVYSIAVVVLASRHAEVLEVGSKRRAFLEAIRASLLEELARLEALLQLSR